MIMKHGGTDMPTLIVEIEVEVDDRAAAREFLEDLATRVRGVHTPVMYKGGPVDPDFPSWT